MNNVITDLEFEWTLEKGFLGLLRQGEFSKEAFDRLVGLLKTISLNDEELIEARLVSLLWYIPVFMSWQKERVIEEGTHESIFEDAISQITNHLEKILGIP